MSTLEDMKDLSINEKGEKLQQAVKDGNLDTVVQLLQDGADVNWKDGNEHTTLHVATMYGSHESIVSKLIECKADVNAFDAMGYQPLHFVASTGNFSCMSKLLESKADAAATIASNNKEHKTPLHFSAKGGHSAALKMLIKGGADVTACDTDGQQPLTMATLHRHYSCVCYLLECKADATVTDRMGRTLILNAEACGSHKIADELQAHGAGDGELYKRVNVVQLLQDGADIKSKDEDGVSAEGKQEKGKQLLKAVQNYELDTVVLLLKEGADINWKDEDGHNAFDKAKEVQCVHMRGDDEGNPSVRTLKEACTSALLEHGGQNSLLYTAVDERAAVEGMKERVAARIAAGDNVNARGKDGFTALDKAVKNKKKEYAAELREHGGQHTLLYAAEEGIKGMVVAHIAAGSDVNARGSDEKTPVHHAAINGHIEALTLLIGAGGDVNAGDKDEKTPVHHAAVNGHVEALTLLIEAGGDVNAGDKSEHSVVMMAIQNGHPEVAVKLIVAGAKLDMLNTYGRSVLMEATMKGYPEVAAKLIAAGVKIDLQCECGNSALIYASDPDRRMVVAKDGGHHSEVAVKLIAAGAQLDLQNSEGGTALMGASHCGNHEVVAKLTEAGAKLDLQSTGGHSALMRASMKGIPEVVAKLIAVGAKLDLQDKREMTALDHAEQWENQEVVELLKAKGAKQKSEL